jgi:hypothetical protein
MIECLSCILKLLRFNSMFSAKETTVVHCTWGNDGITSNILRHSWGTFSILVKRVNECLVSGEEPLRLSRIMSPRFMTFLVGPC